MSDYLHLYQEIFPFILPVVLLSMVMGMVLASLMRRMGRAHAPLAPVESIAPQAALESPANEGTTASPAEVGSSALPLGSALSEEQVRASDPYLALSSEYKALSSQQRRLARECEEWKARHDAIEAALEPMRNEVGACNAQILMLLEKQRQTTEAAARSAEHIRNLETELAAATGKQAPFTGTRANADSEALPLTAPV
ncbi:MAG: hypothetical protein IPK32_10870 [Verrucomicrobiaceae bacterium]|nr:hypothetical protein [Verrucomicrobiaceae bacterium]